jgi:hypothetical protein
MEFNEKINKIVKDNTGNNSAERIINNIFNNNNSYEEYDE